MEKIKTKISVRVDEWHDWTDEADCLLYNAALVNHYDRFGRDSIQWDDEIKDFLLCYYDVFWDLPKEFSFDLQNFRDFCKDELSEKFEKIYEWHNFSYHEPKAAFFWLYNEEALYYGAGHIDYEEARADFLEFFKKFDWKTLCLQEVRGYSQGEVWSLYTFEKWDHRGLSYLTDCLCGCSFYCIDREYNYETVDSICGVYIPDLYNGNTEAKNIEIAKKAMYEIVPDILDGLSDDEIVWDFSL